MLKKIAIVGISAEFPSGSYAVENLDHSSFFEFLLKGGDSYEVVPSDRFNIRSWNGKGLGQINTNSGSFLKNTALFDHIEFGISAKEVKNMALSTRKLIEHAFLALLDSGIDYRGRNVGCYMSGVSADAPVFADPDEYEARGSFAGYPYAIANKVSYHLDLTGPSIPIDTACSSSLTALHLAVQALRAGDCESAVIGGAQLNQRVLDFVQYSQGSLLAHDGKCKPFDASADGFSRGEGVCAIVLKPLEDAIHDNDYIYATVVGTGINSSGGAGPVSAPVGTAQADAMRRAFKDTGRTPDEVDFVELHATGTAIGDPTEANWAGENFQRDGELLIGSVKGNIGHLEITAFLASLSKVCSIMKTGLVPPNINFNKPNPAIFWDRYKLRVPTEVTKLNIRHDLGQPLISIASSGIGGANGHAIIEGAPRKAIIVPELAELTPLLLVSGGLTPRATSQIASDVSMMTTMRKFELHKISSIYWRRARQMTWRSYAIWTPGEDSVAFSEPVLTPRSKPPLVFVFPGQGPQHIEMGRQLYAQHTVFRQSIDRMDQVYQRITGQSLVTLVGLFNCVEAQKVLPEIWPIETTLPGLAMLQMAMFDLLTSFGIVPDVVVGHSAGETAMLYASGASSQEMAMEIAIARGRVMTAVEKLNGGMAALNCDPTNAKLLIEEVTSTTPGEILEIACYNSSDSLTLSGSNGAIERLVDLAKKKGISATKLRTHVAVHSSMMEECRDAYVKAMEDIFVSYTGVREPTVTTYSSTTGEKWTGSFSSGYYWDNARQPVLFSDAFSSILTSYPTATVVEISPHPVLSPYLHSLGANEKATLCPMRRSKNPHPYHEQRTLLDFIGKMATLGYNSIDIFAINKSNDLAISAPLPAYPFSKKHVPVYSESAAAFAKHHKHRNGPLNDENLKIGLATHPDIAEHIIMSEPILPAAGFLEMVFEFGAKMLWNVEFRSILPLLSEKLLHVDLKCEGKSWSISSRSSNQQDQGHNVSHLHADGYMTKEFSESKLDQLDIAAIRGRCQALDSKEFYKTLSYFAQYGPKFQRVTSCFIGNGEGMAEIRGARNDISDAHAYVIHPAILDACFHIMAHPSMTANADVGYYYLPDKIRTVIVHSTIDLSLVDVFYTHAVFKKWGPEMLEYDLTITDKHGTRLCTFIGFQNARHRVNHNTFLTSKHYDIVHQRTPRIPDQVLLGGSDAIAKANVFQNGDANMIIINFRIDNVLELQKLISEVSGGKSKRDIWVLANLNADGFAARGFTRTLRKELFSLNLRLVLLDERWKAHSHRDIVHKLSNIRDLENEVFIDHQGFIQVPRMVEIESAPTPADGHSSLPTLWSLDNQQVVAFLPPKLRVGFVTVRITYGSPSEGGLTGFSGFVENPGSSKWEKQSPVFGVYHGDLSNCISVHEAQLAPLENIDNSRIYADIALPLTIMSFCLGIGVFADPKRVIGRHIGLTQHSFVSQYLQQLLSKLGAQLSVITNKASIDTLTVISECDTVLCGYSTSEDIQFIKSNLRRDAALVHWNDPACGLPRSITVNPWMVGDTLRESIGVASLLMDFDTPTYSQEPEDYLDLSQVKAKDTLFDPSQAYLLIGGIGSIGIHVALWMYEHGARNLVLTSRSGRQSLDKTRNIFGIHMLGYLENLPDLNIQLLSCDASSDSDMTKILQSIDLPLGGCILMSALLSDRLFISHTRESFYKTFPPKEGAVRVLERNVDIPTLEFVVSISSAATLGNVGQTNYSSANTMVDGMVGKYRNAFSLIIPVVNDSTTMNYTIDFKPDPRFVDWMPWSMSTAQLCDCLGRGIQALSHTEFGLYIPNFDWKKVQKHLGNSPIYNHLVQGDAPSTLSQNSNYENATEKAPTLKDIVLGFVDVSAEDFSPEVPLTSYGLDSLSAGRLSHALMPYLKISQLQLLAYVSLNDLEARIESSNQLVGGSVNTSVTASVEGKAFDWSELNKSGETVVKLVDREGIPLILIHGGSGNIVAMMPLQDQFQSPLWAIQTTPETPLGSLEEMASFYFLKIKEARPTGPYRLGGYCASSLVTHAVAQLLEANGDEIVQFLQVDHFPTLFTSPICSFDEETLQTRKPSSKILELLVNSLLDIYARESSIARQKLGTELAEVHRGKEGRQFVESYYHVIRRMSDMTIDFLLRLTEEEGILHPDDTSIRTCLEKWMNKVKTPVTVLVASRGIRTTIPDIGVWSNLGADKYPRVRNLLVFDAGHFSIFEKKDAVQVLEKDW